MRETKTAAAKADASAKSLRKETGKEERKVEAKTGRDLKKGADRVEERARSAGMGSARTTQKSD